MCKIKTTITLSAHIKEFAKKESKALGLDFSAYITLLIAEKLRNDTLIPNGDRKLKEVSNEPSKLIDSEIEEILLDDEQKNELNRLMGL
ncbi:MAG: hypothetical protein ACRC68_08640 [Clostridium sp.]